MPSYRVTFDITEIDADNKQEAADFVRALICNGGETWTWLVKDEGDLSDEGEEVDA